MPSRLAGQGVTYTFKAVRSFAAPNGTVYANGQTVPGSALKGVKHLNALIGKYLLLIPSAVSRVGQAEIDSIVANDVKVTQPFFQPHQVTVAEVRSL